MPYTQASLLMGARPHPLYFLQFGAEADPPRPYESCRDFGPTALSLYPGYQARRVPQGLGPACQVIRIM